MVHATWSRAASTTARGFCYGLLLCATVLAGCAGDSVNGDDGDDDDSGIDGGPSGPDAPPSNAGPCNMTGVWVVEQHTTSIAIGFPQLAVNYYYYDISQEGDAFTIDKQLHCGFVVSGSANVTLPDATLAALAETEFAGPGRRGTFTQEGDSCHFSLERNYDIRGANKARFLTDIWNMGDPPKSLDEFPALPATTEDGMEDWDHDGEAGITLIVVGPLNGNRRVAQRDWTEHEGTVPASTDQFGGEGVIVVHWKSEEAIGPNTDFGLDTTATPMGDGWARYARVGDQLEVVDGNPLQTCKNVQTLANSSGFWH